MLYLNISIQKIHTYIRLKIYIMNDALIIQLRLGFLDQSSRTEEYKEGISLTVRISLTAEWAIRYKI